MLLSTRGIKRLLSGLTPNVFRLGWVSFLGDISSEMLYPIIPIFLTTVIGAPVSIMGVIEGKAEATASLLKSYSGNLSDQTGRRKPFIFGGYLCSALARPLLALAFGWPLVLVARCLDRIGKGLRSSPRDALIVDSVDRPFIGKALGWHRGMDTLGAVIGPLVAILWIHLQPGHLRLIFLVAFVPGILSTLLALTAREVSKPFALDSKNEMESKVESSDGPALGSSKLPRPFQKYLFAWACFSLTNSSDMFLVLRAKELGFDTVSVILLYCFYNFIYAVGSPFLGHLSDHWKRKHVLIAGLLVFASVYGAFAVIRSQALVWVLYGVYGIYMAATDSVGKALAMDLVSPQVRGRALGILGTVNGFALLVSSSIAGWLWTRWGSSATFFYGATGAVISAVVFIFAVHPPKISK